VADELRDLFARVFPFILMMWLVAGAVQPAVDMTAGEKERGTMETLLISPAERSEIVVGKFLAVTTFSFAAVVWNVVWLAGGGFLLETLLGFPIINPAGLVWCVVLGLPQAMLFSAVSLALGVFARSTKEGQYYLMPLMLLTMPLAFWSMMPGTELGPETCWVPVTGAMLLQQRLLAVSGGPVPWEYVGPVLGALAGWVALALGVAVWQFRREGVLFRETGPEKGGPLTLFRRAG
jgi:sodium transport system permease protein